MDGAHMAGKCKAYISPIRTRAEAQVEVLCLLLLAFALLPLAQRYVEHLLYFYEADVEID